MPPLKDRIDPHAVAELAELVAAGAGFDAAAFVAQAGSGLAPLELKARIAHVAHALGRHLPGPFPRAAAVVRAVAGTGRLDAWTGWPCTEWVARNGLDDPDAALATLAALTPSASAEFAVRPFLDAHPGLTRDALQRWAADPSEHLRRLVSEGTRPLLPWAPRVALLRAQPGWAVPLLDRLRADPSPYVRRSVANHLNDLGRVTPALALEVATGWSAAGGPHTATVLRHGLRGLVKRGDPEALHLLGVDVHSPVRVAELALLTPTVRIGESLRFRVVLHSDAAAPVRAVVDHVVHHIGADGARRPKVFKLATPLLAPGADVELVKAHPMRPISTRTYRPGRHRLEIQVNGRVLAGAEFELAAADPAGTTVGGCAPG